MCLCTHHSKTSQITLDDFSITFGCAVCACLVEYPFVCNEKCFDKHTTMISTLQCHLWLLFMFARSYFFLSVFSLLAVAFLCMFWINRLYKLNETYFLFALEKWTLSQVNARSLARSPANSPFIEYMINEDRRTYRHALNYLISCALSIALLCTVCECVSSLHRIFYSFW